MKLAYTNVTSWAYAVVKKNDKLRTSALALSDYFIKSRNFLQSWGKNTTFPLPVDRISSLKQVVENSDILGNTFIELDNGSDVHRITPKSIEPLHWKFRKGNVFKTHPTFVASINESRVFEEGIVITSDNQLADDVSKGITPDGYEPFEFKTEKLPVCKTIKGTVALLTAPSGQGYYHWMMDVMPRLGLLQQAGYALDKIDKFVVNNYVSSFHIETLRLMGIERDRVIASKWNPHILGERLLVPSLVGNMGYPPKWACEFLRNAFMDKRSASTEESRRIYIMRGKANHRRVNNEADVIAFLEGRGFKSVLLEQLSIPDIIGLLSSAEVVVGPHGAGMTNVVFSPPGTKVIEVFSPEGVNTMYWTLSHQCAHDYYCLLGEGELPPENVDPGNYSVGLTINIDKLAATLDLADVK